MTVALYEVIGDRAYRGHQPGQRFTARLDPKAEGRALLRGNILVIDRMIPALPPGYRLPPGWADRRKATEAPAGVSFVEGSG